MIPTGRLQEKVALVTGSGSGIGAAIARRFAEEGALVVVHDHPGQLSRARRVAEGIGEASCGCCVLADLAEPAVCAALIEAAVSVHGRLDILVNNAAAITRGDLETTDAALFDQAMAVNARAPFLLAQAALPQFRRQGGGAVVNIGSVNGYCGEKNQLAYAMSKGALMTMSRNLADALGLEGVRVNHLNLGWVLSDSEYATKQREGLPPDWPTRLPVEFAPSGRLLAPEEIASFVVAFVEDGAGPVSGAVIDLEQYPVIGRNPQKSVSSS